MNQAIPKFRMITGNPTFTRLSATQARALCNHAETLVKHGTGFTHSTVAVLSALVWKFCHRTSGVCMPSIATLALAARVSITTAKTALRHLEALGILTRHKRESIWVVAGISIRVRISNAYTFSTDLADGVGQKSASKQRTIDNSKDNRDLSASLRRQAVVAIGWFNRREQFLRAESNTPWLLPAWKPIGLQG